MNEKKKKKHAHTHTQRRFSNIGQRVRRTNETYQLYNVGVAK